MKKLENLWSKIRELGLFVDLTYSGHLLIQIMGNGHIVEAHDMF